MKNKRFLAGILGFALVFGLILIGCDNGTVLINTEQTEPNEPTIISAIDFDGSRFAAIYNELITRSDGQGGLLDMGQAANCQYVWNAINKYKGTNIQPVAGAATKTANVEYLLKAIDKVNDNATSYGTTAYATRQVVDTIAVNAALSKIILQWDYQRTSVGKVTFICTRAGYLDVLLVGGGGGGGGASATKDWSKYASGVNGSNGSTISKTINLNVNDIIEIGVGGAGGGGTSKSGTANSRGGYGGGGGASSYIKVNNVIVVSANGGDGGGKGYIDDPFYGGSGGGGKGGTNGEAGNKGFPKINYCTLFTEGFSV
jgi:hypothetical protein